MSDEIAEMVRNLRYYADRGSFVGPLANKRMSEAASALERLEGEKAAAVKLAEEQTALATKSIRRLAEKTEPGEIGAFASRDHWKAKAEAAEARLAEAVEAMRRINNTAPLSDHEGHRQCIKEAAAFLAVVGGSL